MKEKKLSISIEDQLEILLPAFENYAQETKEGLQTERGEEGYTIEMRMIFAPNKEDLFPKRYVLQESWGMVQEFLSGTKQLKCIVEKGEKGLVKRNPVYWVFFDAKIAHSFFSSHTVPKIKKVIDLITLADWYLEKERALSLDSFVRKQISPLLLVELGRVIESQSKPNASLPEKRIKRLFKLGSRYYRARNELESSYFNKILSDDMKERLKGLKLMQKKVQMIQSKNK